MKKLNVLLWLTFSAYANGQPITLGTAGNFGALAGSTVTNTGPSVVTGDVGVSPGSAVTGFPPGIVIGTIHAADATSAQAQTDLTTAYNTAAGLPPGTTVSGTIGSGQTLTPGTYTSLSSLGITGTLNLNGAGIYIFQIASTLTTASGSQVLLGGGATADNVFWQVGSSATLGTGSTFNGNILALTSVTVTTGATLNGRALARNGAVTLDTNSVTSPGGGGPGPPAVPAPSSLILVAIGLACAALYMGRERLLRHLRKS